MPSKTVEIDYDVELDDVLEFIEYADKSDLKEISEALLSEGVDSQGVATFIASTASAQLAAKQLQEALDRHGIEWVADKLNA